MTCYSEWERQEIERQKIVMARLEQEHYAKIEAQLANPKPGTIDLRIINQKVK